MKNYFKIIPICLTIFAMTFSFIPTANALDVFIVYAGADKAAQKELKKTLKGKGLKVKSYNTDLLAMADYSGKQKVIAKLSKAKLVTFTSDKAKEAIGEAMFSSAMSVSGVADADKIAAKVK